MEAVFMIGATILAACMLWWSQAHPQRKYVVVYVKSQ